MSFSILKKIFALGILLSPFISLSQNIDAEIDSLSKAVFSMPENKLDSIVKAGNKILNHTEAEGQKARLLGILAVAHFKNNDLKKSTELLFLAKSAAETTADHELIAKVYGSIAHQYIQLNLNGKATFYLDKAIDQINKLPDGNNKQLLKGLSYIELGNVASENKDHLSANKNYRNSLVQFQKIIDPEPQSVYHYQRALYNIGNSYTYLNEFDEAEKYLNLALNVKTDANNGLKYFIYNSLAKVYSHDGAYQRAVDSLKIILNDSNFNDFKLKSDIYLRISQNYNEMGNKEQFFIYNERYIELNDSIQKNDFKAINSAINTEQKYYDIALSDADRNNQQLMIVGLFFLFIFLSVIFYLIKKRKKEKIIFENVISALKERLRPSITEETIETTINETRAHPNPVEEELLFKLKTFEDSEDFTNSKLNIATLAVQLKTNTSYLSAVINGYKGKNFNAYINELRIEYICKKIYNNPKYSKYKISYLAEESGFASHSAFTTVFKNVTGISPSAFLRETAKRKSVNLSPEKQ